MIAKLEAVPTVSIGGGRAQLSLLAQLSTRKAVAPPCPSSFIHFQTVSCWTTWSRPASTSVSLPGFPSAGIRALSQTSIQRSLPFYPFHVSLYLVLHSVLLL